MPGSEHHNSTGAHTAVPDPAHPYAGEAEFLHPMMAAAGELAQGWFERGTKSWSKGDGTPVSEADLAVDRFIRDKVATQYPGDGWLCEESTADQDRLAQDRVWVVDPIDGTRSFVAGGNEWSISVALVVAGRPVLGAVLRPLTGEYYQALKGTGAFCNGERLQVAGRTQLADAHIIGHKGVLRPERWRKPWPEVACSLTVSLALRLCLVAQGVADGTIAVGRKSDWDLAAGDLIVHEAGGRACDLAGQRFVYNQPETRQQGLVCAGPGLYGQMAGLAAGFIR